MKLYKHHILPSLHLLLPVLVGGFVFGCIMIGSIER